MPAYVVKHLADEQGPISALWKDLKKLPYAYTNKHKLAEAAASGQPVYVIEVLIRSKQRVYRLAYRYTARQILRRAGGAVWKDQFKFKVAADTTYKEGVYLPEPVEIENELVVAWLKALPRGMAEIPSTYTEILDGMLAMPENNPQPL